MAIEKRGVQHIRTMAGMVDRRRVRSSSGALLELSMLEMEKQRLSLELKRAQTRCAEILTRTLEIEAKQGRLHRFVTQPVTDGLKPLSVLSPVQPLPTFTAPVDGLKRRQLSY